MNPFESLPSNHFGAILADPPWEFKLWSQFRHDGPNGRGPSRHYRTMSVDKIAALPVADIAAKDCVLFLWTCWPKLLEAAKVIEAWGFEYKTCAFTWMKAQTSQMDLFRDDCDATIGMGYWTRSNSEACLLATRGKPKRLHADVRQGIIEPRREHSRRPDVHGRIERLVGGPYVELFARQSLRRGWTFWGNETAKFATIEQTDKPDRNRDRHSPGYMRDYLRQKRAAEREGS